MWFYVSRNFDSVPLKINVKCSTIFNISNFLSCLFQKPPALLKPETPVVVVEVQRQVDSVVSTRMSVGVGRSRRYCNTGYDQSQALFQMPEQYLSHDIFFYYSYFGIIC